MITPGQNGTGWTCPACDDKLTPVKRTLRWMALLAAAGRTSPLDHADARALTAELQHRGISAERRGGRDSWYTTSHRVMWLDQPFLTSAHGALLDSLEHDFPARLPYPATAALLSAFTS